MTSRVLLILLMSLAAQTSLAEIEITGVAGVSNFDANLNDQNSEGNPIVYGGVAGSLDNCSDDEDGNNGVLCNNCEELTGTWEICNENRIYDGLVLSITFRSDAEDSAGRAFLRDGDDSLNEGTTPILSSGATHTVDVLWSDVCGAIEEGADTCEGMTDSKALSLRIEEDGDTKDSIDVTFFVATPDESSDTNKATIDLCDDSTGTDSQGGICEFTAFPGDEKIFIDQVGNNGSFPNEDNIQINTVRVFISDVSFDSISGPGATTDVLSPEDLSVTENADSTIDVDQTVDGLTNGTRYFFKVGVVDLAGNFSRATSDAAIISACGSTSPGAEESCVFSAIPDEVLGLLTEDFNCFIATAAYGSTIDSRLSVFREFRSKVLNKISWGKKLVAWYYKKGPYAARWLHDHPSFKPLVRALLWPALGVSWMANKLGLFSALAIFMLGMFVTWAIPFAFFARRKLG